MILNEDKISHIAHLVLNGLKNDPQVKLLGQPHQVLKEIKRSLVSEMEIDDEIDSAVRHRLASYKRKIVEGSSEWDVLYRKAFEEALKRRGR